jgi:formylglycine-generating enzyme required for sulfatase activity
LLKGTRVHASGKFLSLALGFCFTIGSVSRADAPAGDQKPFTQQITATDVKFDMLPIPGGKAMLGSPDSEKGRKDDEGPQVEVQIEPFYMGKYEVTQTEYMTFASRYNDLSSSAAPIPQDKTADAVTYPTPLYELDAGPILQRMGRGGQFPAVIMSHYSARQYTKWLSKKTGRFYRLPTEAEWEYACRAGTTTPYSFGDDPAPLGDYAWYFDNSKVENQPAYHEVGKKKPNPWGLYDMHGNVAELVIDQYDAARYKQLGELPKPLKAFDAILWPSKQYPRLARGGSYEDEAVALRSAARHELKSRRKNPKDQKEKPGMNLQDPQTPKSPFWYANGFWVGMRLVSPVKQPTPEEMKRFWDEMDATTADVIDQKKDRIRQEIVTPVAGK